MQTPATEAAISRQLIPRSSATRLALVGLAFFGWTMPARAQQVEARFDRYEVTLGAAKRQTVMTGFLLGGPVAELAVVSADDSGDRHLHVYGFRDGAWVRSHDLALRPQVLFVDVANIAGRDRILTYEGPSSSELPLGRLSWLDLRSGRPRDLVDVASSFAPPRDDEVPHVDLTRDVNGDGRDDLVVPDKRGFRVFVQTAGGRFADALQLGAPTDLSGILGADGYRYDPWSVSRIHEVDLDRDGRRDLAFWSEDHFEVHFQEEGGTFFPEAETLTTEVPFDSDDVFSLATGDMAGRVLHSLADVNGDGTADMVIFSLDGRRPSKKRSAWQVHFGEPAPDGGTAFSGEVGAEARAEGRIQFTMDRHRLGGDHVALMFTAIQPRYLERSLWKQIKGAMGDDVWLSLELYDLGTGILGDQPDAVRRIALDGAPSHREPGWVPLDIVLRGRAHQHRTQQGTWPRAFNRTLLIGDVTGDGRSDLLLEAEFTELHVFAGVPESSLFAEQPTKVKVALHDEEYTWLVDLNKDGRQDILMHQPFTSRNAHGAPKQPPGTEPQRVTMLIAR